MVTKETQGALDAVRAEVAQALLADGPQASRREQLMLYGRFVGAWDVEVTNHAPGKPAAHSSGEWLFSWALEGRAVQDVWIVPARGRRGGNDGWQPYGTTLRFRDPAGDHWRIVWVNPVSGDVSLMTARAAGGEIVQEGKEDDGRRYRWVFFAIERDRFRWRAEETADGSTWTLRQEMVVTRRTAASGVPA